MPGERYTPPPNDTNPVHWQRYHEENAYRVAAQVAKFGFRDAELFVTGFALNQISGDDFNYVGRFKSVGEVKNHWLENSEVRRAEMLGRMSFELSRPDIPENIRLKLEETLEFIAKTKWDSIENIWQSSRTYGEFHDFFESQKEGEMKNAYNYAMNAQLSMIP